MKDIACDSLCFVFSYTLYLFCHSADNSSKLSDIAYWEVRLKIFREFAGGFAINCVQIWEAVQLQNLDSF